MPKKTRPQSAKEWNAVLDNLKREMGRVPWTQLWDGFLSSERNRNWWDRLGSDRPLYAVLPKIARALSAQGLRTTPVFSPGEVQSETEFFKACERRSERTVGVAGGGYIESPLAGERPSLKKMLERHRDVDWADEFLRRLEAMDPNERLRLEITLEEPDVATYVFLTGSGSRYIFFPAFWRSPSVVLNRQWGLGCGSGRVPSRASFVRSAL